MPDATPDADAALPCFDAKPACDPSDAGICDPYCQTGCGCREKCSVNTAGTLTCNPLGPDCAGILKGCVIQSSRFAVQTDNCGPGQVCIDNECGPALLPVLRRRRRLPRLGLLASVAGRHRSSATFRSSTCDAARQVQPTPVAAGGPGLLPLVHSSPTRRSVTARSGRWPDQRRLPALARLRPGSRLRRSDRLGESHLSAGLPARTRPTAGPSTCAAYRDTGPASSARPSASATRLAEDDVIAACEQSSPPSSWPRCAGCYRPNVRDGGFLCADGGACPEGFHCATRPPLLRAATAARRSGCARTRCRTSCPLCYDGPARRRLQSRLSERVRLRAMHGRRRGVPLRRRSAARTPATSATSSIDDCDAGFGCVKECVWDESRSVPSVLRVECRLLLRAAATRCDADLHGSATPRHRPAIRSRRPAVRDPALGCYVQGSQTICDCPGTKQAGETCSFNRLRARLPVHHHLHVQRSARPSDCPAAQVCTAGRAALRATGDTCSTLGRSEPFGLLPALMASAPVARDGKSANLARMSAPTDPAAVRVPDAAYAAARRQARGAGGGARRRVRERGRRGVVRRRRRCRSSGGSAAGSRPGSITTITIGTSTTSGDPRFVLCTKAEHGACPEIVTPEMVRAAGPVDTVAMHLDLDGLYSGAKWVLGGVEPYEGADADARAVDTRRGEPGPDRDADRSGPAGAVSRRDAQAPGDAVPDRAHEGARAVGGDRGGRARDRPAARREPPARGGVPDRGRRRLRRGGGRPYDKTELLLLGQERAPVAVVRDSGSLDHRGGLRVGVRLREAVRPRRRDADARDHPRGAPRRGDGEARRARSRGTARRCNVRHGLPATRARTQPSRGARRARAVGGGRAARRAGGRGAAAVAAGRAHAGRGAARGAVPRVAPPRHRRRQPARPRRGDDRGARDRTSRRRSTSACTACCREQATGARTRTTLRGAARQADHRPAARGAPRGAGDAGQGRAGRVRAGSGRERHRRDRRLLSGPVRDRDLPGRAPAARLRRRGGAAHADRVRALAHRHRHPPGRDHRLVVLHRSRHRHRRRRDQPHRRSGAHLPGRHAGRAVGARSQQRRQAGGQAAPPDHRGRRHDLRQRDHPRRPHRDRRAARWSAATPGSRSRCRRACGSGSGPRGRATLSPRTTELLRDVSAQILEAQRPIRVLRILAWGEEVERAFFAGKGRELPRPEYRVPPEVGRRGRPLSGAQGGGPGRQRDRGLPARHLRRLRHRGAHAGGGRDARLLPPLGRALRAPGEPDRRSPDDQPRSGRALHAGGRRRRGAGADPEPARRARLHRRGGGAAARGALRAVLPGPRHPGRARRRHRRQGGGRRRRRAHQARRALLAARPRPARVPRGARPRGDRAQRARPAGHVVHRLPVAAHDRDPGGAGGADRVPDPLDQHRADAAARRPDAGDQDGRGGGGLLRALPVLPGPRPRRARRPTTARAASAGAASSRAARRSPRTSATWTACCG